MKPKSIGVVAGGGGPGVALSLLQDIVAECQKQQGVWKSSEYPRMHFYNYPYSEGILLNNNPSQVPSRELESSIKQLKLLGMEIIVVPCFTLSTYLEPSLGQEVVEVGAVMRQYLEKHALQNPLVLCSERTRNSGYCDRYFNCHYPSQQVQQQLRGLLEEVLTGKRVDLRPLLRALPDALILGGATVLNAHMEPIDDPRWINANQLLAQYVVQRSYSG